MAELVEAVLVLGIMLAGFRIMTRGLRGRSRTARRSNLPISSLAGGNLGLVLAALAVTQLVFELGLAAPAEVGTGGLVAVGFGLLLVAVVFGRAGAALIELVGLVAFVALMFAERGPEVGMAFTVAAVAMVIATAVLRALLRA